MAKKKAALGDPVYATVDPRINNDEDVAMAFVTRVKEDSDGDQRVNLRVLLDTGADLRLTNVRLLDKRPPKDRYDAERSVDGVDRVAFWPTRS